MPTGPSGQKRPAYVFSNPVRVMEWAHASRLRAVLTKSAGPKIQTETLPSVSRLRVADVQVRLADSIPWASRSDAKARRSPSSPRLPRLGVPITSRQLPNCK